MLFKYCWIKLFVLELFQSSNQIVCTDFLYQDHLVCYEYLVSGTKYNVSDEHLSASSQYNIRHAAKWGRLNTVYVKDEHVGGWEAANNKPPHYIEVRFNELTIIQAIATQGRNITGDPARKERYVTKYRVYSLGDTGLWVPVRGGPGQEPMVFQGNNDSNSIRTNKLPCAVQALAVRIQVIESQRYPSMRFDVLGCPVSQVNLSPDCDFEDGFCGWKQEYDNESVNWEIKSGATSASNLLKLHDHTRKHDCTFEDGFCNWKNEDNSWTRIDYVSQRYIVVTGENKNTSTKAILLGPEVDTGYNSSCLSFSFNLSGDENNSLSALLLLNKKTTLGKLHGKDYDGWRNAFYEIVNNGEMYRIQFLADVTTGFIGLDNISLIFEPCPKQEKDNKTSKVLVGVAVGVGVLGLSLLIVIGFYVGRRRPFRLSAATTSIKTDLKMALSNEISMDTVQEYANVMTGKSESVSVNPIYDNNQGVQSTHQNRLVKEERGHAVVSRPKRKLAQEERIYDHLDTGEKVPRLDDETYDHVKK